MTAEIFGPQLIIVLLVIVVLLFGGAAIPKLARSLGSAKTEFEKGLKEGQTEAEAKAAEGEAGTPESPKDAPTN